MNSVLYDFSRKKAVCTVFVGEEGNVALILLAEYSRALKVITGIACKEFFHDILIFRLSYRAGGVNERRTLLEILYRLAENVVKAVNRICTLAL